MSLLSDTWLRLLRTAQTAPNGSGCDTVLELKDGSILHVHSLVVRAWSSMAFSMLMRRRSKEAEVVRVTQADLGLKGLHPASVTRLVEFLYSGEFASAREGIGLSCAVEMLEASSLWAIPELRELCTAWLRDLSGDREAFDKVARSCRLRELQGVLAAAESHGLGILRDAVAELLARRSEHYIADDWLPLLDERCAMAVVKRLASARDGTAHGPRSLCFALAWANQRWPKAPPGLRAFAKDEKGCVLGTEIDSVMNCVAWDAITCAELQAQVQKNPHALPLRLERFLEGAAQGEAQRSEAEREAAAMKALVRSRGARKKAPKRTGAAESASATKKTKRLKGAGDETLIVVSDSDGERLEEVLAALPGGVQ